MFRDRALLLLALLYLTTAALYFVIVPPLEGFDSIAHMNYANYLRKEKRFPVINPETVDFSYELATQPPAYFMAAAASAAWLPYADADKWVRESENRYFPGKSRRWSVDLPNLPAAVAGSIALTRLMSLLGGLATLLVTWRLMLHWFPGRRSLAAAVVAVTVLNPLFLFMSVIVSNDMWSVALTVAVIWLVATSPLTGPGANRRWLIAGLVGGIALTTKYSVFLTALPALAVLWTRRHEAGWPGVGRAVVLVAAGGLATGGYWYLRNILIYGEVIPLGVAGEVIRSLNRADPMSLGELRGMVPWLFHSYWGVFVSILAPATYFRVLDLAVGVAGAGLIVAALRRQLPPWRILAVVLIWAGVYVAGVLYWTATVSYGEQARLGLAAAPALSLLLVLGWQGLAPGSYAPWIHGLVCAGMIGISLWPVSTLRRAYMQPQPAEPAIDRPLQARSETGIMVEGYALPQGAAVPGDGSMPLTLYLRADGVVQEDLTLFVHLVDDADRLLYQFDGVAFDGRHPTRQWAPGVVFAEEQSLMVDMAAASVTRDAEPLLATLIAGFYHFESPGERIFFTSPDGTPIGDSLVLGPVRLLPEEPVRTDPDQAPAAAWQNGIELLSVDVAEPPPAGQPGTAPLMLTWRTTTTIARPLTVFVQILDGERNVIWQVDRQPQAGRAPTSTWLPLEAVADVYEVAFPAGWSRLIIGLYDAGSGVRTPLADGTDYLDLTPYVEAVSSTGTR